MVIKKRPEKIKTLGQILEENEVKKKIKAALEAGKHSPTVRLLFIIRDLDRTDGMTLEEIRLKYSISTKGAKRAIDTLQEVGLPIVEEERRDRKKVWRIAFRDKLQELASLLDISHYFALIFALRQGSALRGTPIFTAAEDLGDKLLDFLEGQTDREFLKELDNCFYSSEKHAYKEQRHDMIWPLAMAIIKRRFYRVQYRAEGSDEVKTHEVLPLKLMVHTGAVYLVHRWKNSGKMGKLKLCRIEDFKVLDTTGERPSEMEIEKYLTRGFGLSPGGALVTYDLLLRPDKRDALFERIWHHTQVISVRKDGWVKLSFTVGESPEVSSWIRSWGDAVLVLAPKSEIKKIIRYGQWIGKSYVWPRERKKNGAKTGQTAPSNGSA